MIEGIKLGQIAPGWSGPGWVLSAPDLQWLRNSWLASMDLKVGPPVVGKRGKRSRCVDRSTVRPPRATYPAAKTTWHSNCERVFVMIPLSTIVPSTSFQKGLTRGGVLVRGPSLGI